MMGGRFSKNGEIVGFLKRLKGEMSSDLSALEKEGLDRKTIHQDLVKAEAQPRPAKGPPWRDKLQRDIPHDWRRCDRGSEFVVTCNPVQKNEATSQEGVMNVHLCFQHSSCLTDGTQSLHTEPRSREIHCREVSNEIRVNWKTFLDLFKEFKTARANPRSQAGSTAATHRRQCHLGRTLTL